MIGKILNIGIINTGYVKHRSICPAEVENLRQNLVAICRANLRHFKSGTVFGSYVLCQPKAVINRGMGVARGDGVANPKQLELSVRIAHY